MKRFKVIGDPNNGKFRSSDIIISSLNEGLKKLDLYSDSELEVTYDCLGGHYSPKSIACICPMEVAIPIVVFQRAEGKPLIGVSRQNQAFFVQGQYPSNLTYSFLLGVDTQLWKKTYKKSHSKFRFFVLMDSNSRACYEEILKAFAINFSDKHDVELYLKDREATEKFKTFVSEKTKELNINVIHDCRHTEDREIEKRLYDDADCHVFINHSSTFALTVAQGMAMSCPTITMAYSGPADYCNTSNACLVDFHVGPISHPDLIHKEEVGYRNFLIWPGIRNYLTHPEWAWVCVDHLAKQILRVYTDNDYRYEIGQQARVTAESMSWERSALNLAYIINEI